jgi:hypothetical protein
MMKLIDEFDTGWLEQLDRWASGGDEGRQLYLLIDGAFAPGLWRAVVGTVGSDAVSLLFETLPACSDDMKDASPFVLRYAAGNRAVQNVLKKCSGWPMVSALESSESFGQIAARLAAWCVVENDGQRFNFRFPDTRRLPAIFNGLNLEQRNQLAGPAKSWRYIDRTGQWKSLDVTGLGSPVRDRPQKLDDHQFGGMVGDSEADEALSSLGYRGYQAPANPSRSFAVAVQAIAAANAQGLDRDLLLDWCAACLDRDGHSDDEQTVLALAQWRSQRAEWT